jgi:bacillolysin
MLRLVRATSKVTVLAALFFASEVATQAMPRKDKPARVPGQSAFIPGSATNSTPGSGVAANPNLAEWLRQQVATRNSSATASQARQGAIGRLQQSSRGKVSMHFRKNGTPSEIKGMGLERASHSQTRAGGNPHEETARSFLRRHGGLFLSENPDQEWQLRKSERDHLSRQHLRFRQEYKGLPVWPCELIVHLDPNGEVDLMDGAFIPSPRGLGTKPSVTSEQALARANQEIAKGSTTSHTDAELILYGPLDDPPRLAWKFDLSAGIGQAWRCVVDALNGSILTTIPLVNDASVTGSGLDGLGVTRTLNLWQNGATFYMVDTTKTMFDNTSTPPNPNTTRGAILIWDTQNQPPTSQVTTMPNNSVQVTSSSATSGWIADGVDASFGLSQTYDYFLARHARNSLDGAGGSMSGFVRVGVNWPNAQWLGDLKIMRFGDGLTRALDVCGHELTHGVINSIGDGGILNYHDQPGALNESFADIFGQNVEARTRGTTDWLVGAELTGAINGPIRNMLNPGALQWTSGSPYPSKMSQFYQLARSTDVGGVHINSSIINHCYYLLATGLPGAINVTNAEKIFYRAMTLHLAKESQFIDARHACISSAEEIFGVGSAQALKTAEAFDAVEIVDAPSTPPPSPIPTVPAADSTMFLRWNPFANGFFGAYELYRREAAQGDSVSGTFINTLKYLAPERVSVAGDGSFAFFVTEDSDYGVVNTDGTLPELGGFPGTVHSLAMTPDGQKFAFILLDSQGQPTNLVAIIDLESGNSTLIKLFGVDSEGNKQDIIQYADVLDFTSDGKRLIYDAYSESHTAGTNILSGWTIYSLDIATTNVTALISLSSTVDIGNPSLGKTKNNLLTFEVINKQTGLATVWAGDLFESGLSYIAQNPEAGALGTPDYTGDDRAIIFSYFDPFVTTLYDLVTQPLASDGLTTNGAPSLWLVDADYVSMYRRGTFIPTNALPTVALTNPVNGQIFAPAANILLQANASDPGGSLAKVEFYEGSTKLGEKLAAPYSLIWSNVSAGNYRVSARAIDNLGGAVDSVQVAITVANRPKLTNSIRLSPSLFQFALMGDVGAVYVVQHSTNLINWITLTTVTNAVPTITVQDSTIAGQPRRFYRALLQ